MKAPSVRKEWRKEVKKGREGVDAKGIGWGSGKVKNESLELIKKGRKKVSGKNDQDIIMLDNDERRLKIN